MAQSWLSHVLILLLSLYWCFNPGLTSAGRITRTNVTPMRDGSRRSDPHNSTTKRPIKVIWKEEILTTPKERTQSERRQLFSVSSGNLLRRSIHQGKSPAEPHKLRTDQWQIELQWQLAAAAASRQKFNNIHNNIMQLEFADNGYVRQMSLTENAVTEVMMQNEEDMAQRPVGKWTCSTVKGVSWTLADGNTTDLVFHAQLLLNPFGRQPKMIRGVVLLENPAGLWFRPIVATFSGIGVGKDTADFSYQQRQRKQQH